MSSRNRKKTTTVNTGSAMETKDQTPVEQIEQPIDAADLVGESTATDSVDGAVDTTVETNEQGSADDAVAASDEATIESASESEQGAETVVVETPAQAALPRHLETIRVLLLGSDDQDQDAYVRVMAPNKVWRTDTGLAAQGRLNHALRHIFNLPAEQFFEAYEYFLSIVAEHTDGCFAPRYALRGIHDGSNTWSKNVGRFFEAMVNLSIRIANPNTRGAIVKQSVEIEKIAAVVGGLNQVYGEKIRAYLESIQ